MMITMNEFKVSPNHVCTNNISKRQLWEETIKVWDWLVENNYRPADFSTGIITMRVEGFAKLTKEADGLASVKETNVYRSNSLWIGNIEVNFVEFKNDLHGGWSLIEGWEPL